MTFIKIFIILILCLLGTLFFTLYKNDANLFQAPGFSKRLTIFLTTNTAVTDNNHEFEELRMPVFDVPADVLYQQVILAGSQLGWQVADSDVEKQKIYFIVLSPVFLFKDDVFIQVQSISMNQSSLYIQSSSRVGRADFAANSGHIQALIKKLKAM
jgi:uncharacterized protein (DUF1499 family)